MPSQIFIIHSIQELIESGHIQDDSFIYWDLDNTIYQPTQELGSDQWFEQFFHIAKTQLAASFQFELMLQTYNAIQAHVEVTHVEPETIQIIKDLKKRGFHQGFLTARNDDLKQITIRQLQAVGIEDASEFPIIFCDGQDKGKMLMAHLTPKPSHIIMIDDKLKNVENIAKATREKEIAFSGFHYNFLLEKVKAFDITCAHFQLRLIQHLLPQQVQKFISSLGVTSQPRTEDEEYPQSLRRAV